MSDVLMKDNIEKGKKHGTIFSVGPDYGGEIRKTIYGNLKIILQPKFDPNSFSDTLVKILVKTAEDDTMYCGRYDDRKLIKLSVGHADDFWGKPTEEQIKKYDELVRRIQPVLDDLPDRYKEVLPREFFSD